ncbi:MAG: type II secretion system protein [Pseudomonadota bacterium]
MNKRAFTLVELLIVLAITGMIIALGIPQVKRIFRANLKTASIQISGVVRFAYDSSVVKSRIHRIVFDFDKSLYKVEVSNTDELVAIDDLEESGSKDDQNEPEKAPQYSPVEGEMGKDRKLPNGVIFDSVENINTKNKITEGYGYLYFFPQGTTENVIIRIKGDKNNTGFYSITVMPVNAKTKIEGRYIEAERK